MKIGLSTQYCRLREGKEKQAKWPVQPGARARSFVLCYEVIGKQTPVCLTVISPLPVHSLDYILNLPNEFCK